MHICLHLPIHSINTSNIRYLTVIIFINLHNSRSMRMKKMLFFSVSKVSVMPHSPLYKIIRNIVLWYISRNEFNII